MRKLIILAIASFLVTTTAFSMSHKKEDIVDVASKAGSFNTLIAAAKAAGAARPQYWKRLCDRYEKTKAFVLGPTAWHNVLGLDTAFYEEAIRKIENGTDSLGEITDTSVGAEAI